MLRTLALSAAAIAMVATPVMADPVRDGMNPAGAFAGGTFPLDMSVTVPTIVGADMTVTGGGTTLSTTAGGLFSGALVLSLAYQ